MRGHAATMLARSFSNALPALLGILLGVLEGTLFSAVFTGGALSFPSRTPGRNMMPRLFPRTGSLSSSSPSDHLIVRSARDETPGHDESGLN
jgi:hypothetical protein